jgi:hypothetical protein
MMNSVMSLSALVIAVLATATVQAHAERNSAGMPRIAVTTSSAQSWTVYAPSGRPVTMRPRQGDNRWWPSN